MGKLDTSFLRVIRLSGVYVCACTLVMVRFTFFRDPGENKHTVRFSGSQWLQRNTCVPGSFTILYPITTLLSRPRSHKVFLSTSRDISHTHEGRSGGDGYGLGRMVVVDDVQRRGMDESEDHLVSSVPLLPRRK